MKSVIAENSEWIENIWRKIDDKLRQVCVRSRERKFIVLKKTTY